MEAGYVLIWQVAVCCVDFHPVEADGHGAPCGSAILFLKLVNLLNGHGMRDIMVATRRRFACYRYLG